MTKKGVFTTFNHFPLKASIPSTECTYSAYHNLVWKIPIRNASSYNALPKQVMSDPNHENFNKRQKTKSVGQTNSFKQSLLEELCEKFPYVDG